MLEKDTPKIIALAIELKNPSEESKLEEKMDKIIQMLGKPNLEVVNQ